LEDEQCVVKNGCEVIHVFCASAEGDDGGVKPCWRRRCAAVPGNEGRFGGGLLEGEVGCANGETDLAEVGGGERYYLRDASGGLGSGGLRLGSGMFGSV